MNFTQLLLVMNARKWLIVSILLLTIAGTVVVSLWLPKEYTAITTLIIDSKSKDPLTGQLQSSLMYPGYMTTQFELIRSLTTAQKVVKELRLTDNPQTREKFMLSTQGKGSIEQWLANLLIPQLDVTSTRESSLINIAFSGTDPQFTALMANAFAKAYIDTSLELRLVPARQTAAWFNEQITQLRANLDKAQQRLTAYQREKGIVESEERLDVETRRLADIAGQVVAAQSSAFEASSRARDSRSMPEVFNNPSVQNLKALIAQDEAKQAELAKRVGVNHPDYQRVQAEIDSYKVKLANELNTASKGLGAGATAARQRFTEMGGAFATQKAQVLDMKQRREEASRLARDLENAQRIYDVALQRYSQSNMEAQSVQTDIAVLNPATPPIKPSKPKVLLNTLLSVVLGTVLGVGIAFLIELLDRRVRSGQDITTVLEIPVLAEMVKPGARFFISRLFRKSTTPHDYKLNA